MDGWVDGELRPNTLHYTLQQNIHALTLAVLRAVFTPLEREETEAKKAGDGS